MSDPVSALAGASFEGFARVADLGPQGMVSLRGTLSAKSLATAVSGAVGLSLPAPGRIETGTEFALAWMSPDELLLLCAYDAAPGLADDLSKALHGTHHLVAVVSDARAVIEVSGSDLRDVIAKLTPADVSPGVLEPGVFRRSRLAQVPAAFWMPDETHLRVVCFRSVAQYVFDALAISATKGAEVDFH